MAGFRKAAALQAAIKMGIYVPPGAGKTFTALLLAEGLAGISGKRVAYVEQACVLWENTYTANAYEPGDAWRAWHGSMT
jgi:hypothetical protein